MPTYDYQCRSCGNRIEVIHAMTDTGPTTCQVCGGPLRRLLYPAGIIFKGSGFYKTDSRSQSTSTPASGASERGAGSGTTEGGASGDRKPESSAPAGTTSSPEP